jgi:2',5'-phosphodiesterase
MLADSPHLAEALQKVTTIAQISLLVPVPPAAGGGAAAAAPDVARLCPPLVVVNTHLFFHPYAPHIRSMHTAAMLEEAAAAVQVRVSGWDMVGRRPVWQCTQIVG